MRLTVANRDAGQRLDLWLTARLEGPSRSRIQAMMRSGNITLEGRTVRPHRKTEPGMILDVVFPPPAPARPIPEAIPINAVYEDADLIVVNKPAGLVVHPAAGHGSGTLVNALLHRCPDLGGIGGERRPGIVHRLDKDTSGVMVVAKNEAAFGSLAAQFRAGRVRKEYLALVHGIPRDEQGTIETLIGRNPRDRKKMSASPRSGRPASTSFRILERLGRASLLRIRIKTGRTHQIRVHAAHMGHPVLGDAQYGSRGKDPLPEGLSASRQMLHAERLGFIHPATGKPVSFTAPLPGDMQAVLDALRQAASEGVRRPPPINTPR